MISHDRDFLKGLTQKSYEFSDGKVKEHLGGIEEFLRAKKVDDFRSWESTSSKKESPKSSKPKNTSENSYQLKKELKKKTQNNKKTCATRCNSGTTKNTVN